MADADDATFEFEEELGLPQGGPVLEDGMDMYDGQQGEGQQEGPGMHDPQHRDTPMLDLQPEVNPPVDLSQQRHGEGTEVAGPPPQATGSAKGGEAPSAAASAAAAAAAAAAARRKWGCAEAPQQHWRSPAP